MRAEEIVDGIIAEMRGRDGIGDAWDALPQAVQKETRERWVAMTRRALGEE